MKRFIQVILLLISIQADAQKITYHSDDTVRTADPQHPGKEYIAVYNNKGNITAQGTMINGKRNGVWRVYSNGNGMLTQISEYKDGVISGANITFGNNGMIASDETYKDNKLHGTRTLMNNMGRPKSVEPYTDGVLNGLKRTVYEDGKPQEEGNWKNGHRDGVTRWYNSKGLISLQYTYVNGVLQGPVKEYDDKGKIRRMGEYKDNNESGEWMEFAEDSVLIKRIFYEKGKVVKETEVRN